MHAIVDGLVNPVEFLLSPGHDHDSIRAIELPLKTEIRDYNILGDTTYGTAAIRNYITETEALYVLAPQSNNPTHWECG